MTPIIPLAVAALTIWAIVRKPSAAAPEASLIRGWLAKLKKVVKAEIPQHDRIERTGPIGAQAAGVRIDLAWKIIARKGPWLLWEGRPGAPSAGAQRPRFATAGAVIPNSTDRAFVLETRDSEAYVAAVSDVAQAGGWIAIIPLNAEKSAPDSPAPRRDVRPAQKQPGAKLAEGRASSTPTKPAAKTTSLGDLSAVAAHTAAALLNPTPQPQKTEFAAFDTFRAGMDAAAALAAASHKTAAPPQPSAAVRKVVPGVVEGRLIDVSGTVKDES